MSDKKVPVPSDYLGPQPQKVNLDAKIDKAADPQKLDFDPVALKERYKSERDKRLNASLSGIDQYKYVEGQFAHMLRDPWIEPGFKRDSITETVDVVVIGGGYGAQLVAVKMIESGITNLRMIEKAGGFGGTWYWNRYPGAQCDIEVCRSLSFTTVMLILPVVHIYAPPRRAQLRSNREVCSRQRASRARRPDWQTLEPL
jgi:hypothetical protein